MLPPPGAHAAIPRASMADVFHKLTRLLTPDGCHEPRSGSYEQVPKEFTFRAVSIGLAIGCLLCFTNLYFGLQTGWISMMSLQSALLGYLITRLLPSFLSFTPQENVVLQTTATATGTMPLAAGFVGILPALGVLDPEKDGSDPVKLDWWAGVMWSCAVAFFGVFLSPPIRKQVIIEEQLAFPSGTATAQLISVLHNIPPPGTGRTDDSTIRRRRGYRTLADDPASHDSHNFEDETYGRRHERFSEEERMAIEGDLREASVSEEEERKAVRQDGWVALGWSFASSALMTLLAYFFPVMFSIPLFGQTLAKDWLWTFTPSLSYVGQGVIMGFPTALSMNIGMIVGWGILSPLSHYKGWAPGPVGDMTTGARGWILWTALAIMVADSVVSLLPVALEFVFKGFEAAKNCAQEYRQRNGGFIQLPITPLTPSFSTLPSSAHPRTTSRSRSASARRNLRSGPSSVLSPAEEIEEAHLYEEINEIDTETLDRLVPARWVVMGLVSSITFGTLLVWAVFGHEGIRPWATVIGFLMGGVLSLLGVRALGETDLNPVSGLGKISQLLFAFIQPGNVVANIIAGGVAEAGAQQAGDLMQDLKTGHLLQASPRAQFYGQLIGSGVSIVVTATAYNLYTRAYPIPGPTFPAPTAYVWLSLARLLRNGHLPDQSSAFMLAFALIFALISFLKTYGRTSSLSRYTGYLPSGVAFAIGFLNTPAFSIARLLGGILSLIYHRRLASRARAEGKDPGGSSDIRLIVVASGFVLGEGVVSVVSLVMKTAGVGVVSCWGCIPGTCAGCPVSV